MGGFIHAIMYIRYCKLIAGKYFSENLDSSTTVLLCRDYCPFGKSLVLSYLKALALDTSSLSVLIMGTR